LGVRSGPAIADVLFGDYNPSGKLAVTFPYAVGQVPLYYNHPVTGRPAGAFKFTSKYIDGPTEPLYPFGFGLSYTTFAYADLHIVPADGQKHISVRVTNTGAVAGEEVVQCYIGDVVGSRVRPVKELNGFEKIALQPGESRTVTFIIPHTALGFYDEAMRYVVEPGDFRVWVGGNSQEGVEGQFLL
jgi:beta-glucosidase